MLDFLTIIASAVEIGCGAWLVYLLLDCLFPLRRTVRVRK
jgi:hypothetical protein